jgi:hypothetical protein
VVTDTDIINSTDSEESFIKTIKTVNEWLWIVIIGSVMIVLIYAWFKLLTSGWKAEVMKEANNVLFYAAIWIWVALLAYVLINILVNFF